MKNLEQLLDEYYRTKQEYERLEKTLQKLREQIIASGITGKHTEGDYTVEVTTRTVKTYSPEKVYQFLGLSALLKTASISSSKLQKIDGIDKEKLSQCVASERIETVLKVSRKKNHDQNTEPGFLSPSL